MLPDELGCKYNEAELSITFPNGSIIELRGADNEDSLRGAGLWGIVIDEYASIYNNWAVLNEVLRPALTDKKGWVLFIGTPKGKDSLFDLYLKGQREEDNYKSFKFGTIDNPWLPKGEVELARKDMPGRYFRQEYEASFEDFKGLIWPEFSEKIHVIKPYYVQTVYDKIGAIDPAITGTTAVLKAFVDEKGDLVIYDEYYEENKRVSEVSEDIKEDKVFWLIDPASKAKLRPKEGKMYSLYDEYRDYGIVAYPAEHDVNAGINRVGEQFKAKTIKIFSTCTKLIWELERYHWAESKESIKGEVLAKPYKKNDHAVDAMRYIVMHRTSKADLRQTIIPHRLSPAAFVREMKEARENN